MTELKDAQQKTLGYLKGHWSLQRSSWRFGLKLNIGC